MCNELRLDNGFIFVTGFAALHCAQAGLRASLTLVRNMGNDLIRFPVKFHTLAFVAGLTAGFTAGLLSETFGSRLVESVIGWRCGTVATVLLMVLLVKLGG